MEELPTFPFYRSFTYISYSDEVFRSRIGPTSPEAHGHKLNRLKQVDPEDKKHIVRIERTFEHRGHLCIVFESLR